jgi:hypothetical protein
MVNREKRKPHGVLSRHRNYVQTNKYAKRRYDGDTVGFASRSSAAMERSVRRVRRREDEGKGTYYKKVGFTGKRRSGKPRNNNKYPSTTKNNKRIFGVF